jgi:hypothetical protein
VKKAATYGQLCKHQLSTLKYASANFFGGQDLIEDIVWDSFSVFTDSEINERPLCQQSSNIWLGISMRSI